MVWEGGGMGVWEGFPKIEDGGSKIALGTETLAASGLNIIAAKSLNDAAVSAVAAAGDQT